MTYRDTWATCEKCGKQFIFRIEQQRRQAARGEEVASPALCPSCQAAARAQRRLRPRSKPQPRPAAEQKLKESAVLGPGPHEGVIKWYAPEKGYGFIIQSDGNDIFFHRTGIAPGETPSFPNGARVTYLIEETLKGPQAVEVARMDVAEEQGVVKNHTEQ